MTSIAYSSVSIQTTAQSAPSTPSWLGEVTLLVHYLRRQGVLDAINERVQFARRRFGRYEVLDFVAVLFGYAISGERTLEAFYERLRHWASAFMALFGHDRLPSRSAFSRWLAALTSDPLDALRTQFLDDLLARLLVQQQQSGGSTDRAGKEWLVFDVDGTREAARQRALPKTSDRPEAARRLRSLCAPGYLGRKRGEIVRTRTTILQAHTSQWLGTFGNAGNGEYRAELRRAVAAIHAYLKHYLVFRRFHCLSSSFCYHAWAWLLALRCFRLPDPGIALQYLVAHPVGIAARRRPAPGEVARGAIRPVQLGRVQCAARRQDRRHAAQLHSNIEQGTLQALL